MIVPGHPVLTITRHCALTGISRSARHGPGRTGTPLNLALMKLIRCPGRGLRSNRREGCAVHGDAVLRQPPDGKASAEAGLLPRAQACPARSSGRAPPVQPSNPPQEDLPLARTGLHSPGSFSESSSLALTGLRAAHQRPRTAVPHPEHRKYPYLLRDLVIERPDQAWCADIAVRHLSRTGGVRCLVL